MNQIPNIEEGIDEIKSALWELGHTAKDAGHIIKMIDSLLHHQLQKDRQDWLRSEIEKLEGMRKKTDYPVSYDTNEGRKWTAMRDNHAGFNTCLDILITRYKEELKELESKQ